GISLALAAVNQSSRLCPSPFRFVSVFISLWRPEVGLYDLETDTNGELRPTQTGRLRGTGARNEAVWNACPCELRKRFINPKGSRHLRSGKERRGNERRRTT